MEAYSQNQGEFHPSRLLCNDSNDGRLAGKTVDTEKQAADELIATLRSENYRLKRQLQTYALTGLVGHSPAMQQLRRSILKAADSEKSVLICGQPGTGKHHAAQAIHMAGSRVDAPFIKINCALLSAEAIDQELFGSTQQTFRGRSLSRDSGLFRAEGGTLFLDAVDSIALTFQRKLLLVLQQKSWHIEQTNELRSLDIRIISASSSDIDDRIRRNLFHREFYNHLTELIIQTPTLRQRTEDIGALTSQILNRLATEEGKPSKRISPEALNLLKGYDWPGNYRELQNVISRACTLNVEPKITEAMLRPWLGNEACLTDESRPSLSLKEMERKLIEATFTRCGGNREQTALSLQIGLRTLSGKLREYGYPPRGGPGSNLEAKRLKAA